MKKQIRKKKTKSIKKQTINAGEELTNRTYKDGVFTTLFNDKEKLCEIYNALHENKNCKTKDIEIQTLEKALYKPFKNDLAFTIDDKFVIIESYRKSLLCAI